MSNEEIQALLKAQRQFFTAGTTREVEYRRKALQTLKAAVIENEQAIVEALHNDLKKPLLESYTTELAMIMNEINFALKNLKRWAKPIKIKPTLFVFPSRSYIMAEPFGVALIISPWNYPLQLTLTPLVGAIAAGNCCVIKPSEFSPASGAIIKKLIGDAFDPGYIAVVEGDAEVSQYLLEQHFDKIFFTGSPRVGKIVMEKAARYLTSVTLELGGKSPCVVDKNVNLEIAAKRIIWGKFINAGQTCIAPDYLIVHKEVKAGLYDELKKWLQVFFGENPQSSPDLGRIINREHFERLKGYLSNARVVAGGSYDENNLYIEPTVIEVTDSQMPVMQEEIFGPILPVIEYLNSEDIENIIALNPDPLGFYLFSTHKEMIEKLINRVRFGGGCINDTLNHIVNHHLPFGGRGTSGIGNYHGIYSFAAFSHQKSIMEKSLTLDIDLKYPPYKNKHKYIKKYLLK